MPRKVRQLKADLRKAGFRIIPKRGKGSHIVWEHPAFPGRAVTVSGRDGADAKPYQEDEVAEAIARTQQAHEE
jgi:predicted RNA binding protein YcfA (HicA-like mRNA interferase family)